MRWGPPSILLVSFAGLIAAGTALLLLPPAAAPGRDVAFIDALFTSTSAVCVTGLVTLDTATAWSPFGQLVILLLIQIGGLGIVTFSTFVVLLLGGRISLSQHEIVTAPLRPLGRVDAFRVVRRILLITLVIEALGAALLWAFLSSRFKPGDAVWHAVFHSVSAFCNAGFSTFSDSLMSFRADWAVNLTIMGLVIAGGLGFVVFLDLENRLRYGQRLGLHTRIVLVTTFALLIAGAAGFYLFEAENTLRDADGDERVLASLFASATARTAGFNTIDYGMVTMPALMLTVLLMLIGGSPGSCAGGLKTTTFAVLLGAARSAVRGRNAVELFRRTIPEVAVRQALALALLGLALVALGPLLLGLTESWGGPYGPGARRYVDLGFESASALGTVGLSTGITPTLSSGGRLVVVFLMYAGRLGLLTIVFAVAQRRVGAYRFAQENVIIG